MLKPWWELRPERLQDELDRLDEAGISYRIDAEERARGRLRVDVDVRVGEQTHHLKVLFPDVYPYTRFEILAPDLELPRHQNPIQKNLCLIGRSTANWNVTDTLADFLQQRFPHVIDVATTDDLAFQQRNEEAQGEPFSEHFTYVPASSILIDSAWRIDPTIVSGKLKIGLESPNHPIHGALLETLAPDGTVLARASAALANRYPLKITGRWVRRKQPPLKLDSTAFIGDLAKRDPNLRQRTASNRDPKLPDVIGVVFEEEIQQGILGDGWIFVARAPNGAGLVRASRGGPDDVFVRSPETAALRDKRVVVVGLGSLGAPAAIEFARCGIREIMLADFDHVEAGTVSRWPLGLSAVGHEKADVLKSFIERNYPYTSVSVSKGIIGGALNAKDYSDVHALNLAMDFDLVLDATAELGIQHLLSDLAIERKKPYVCVSTTAGAWGGMVARIRPGITNGCWVCLQHALEKNAIPLPPAKPHGFIQPPGCASPTFTGSGFDANIIAQAAVRLVVMTLSEENAPWDVEVVSLRDDAGNRIPPITAVFPLERQPECHNPVAHAQGLAT